MFTESGCSTEDVREVRQSGTDKILPETSRDNYKKEWIAITPLGHVRGTNFSFLHVLLSSGESLHAALENSYHNDIIEL